MSKTKQADVVTELLARVGQASILQSLNYRGRKIADVDFIPNVWVMITDADDTDQIVASILDREDEPRRLVLIPGIGWCWYNAEGPEE